MHGKLILELQIIIEAPIFLHTNPSDLRIIQTWQKSVESFRKAAQLFASPVEFIEIPYDGTIPGYFYKVDNGP